MDWSQYSSASSKAVDCLESARYLSMALGIVVTCENGRQGKRGAEPHRLRHPATERAMIMAIADKFWELTKNFISVYPYP
ncbi:MAG: hypothetical protein R3C03_11660 [Pirellulaceae bacterium]